MSGPTFPDVIASLFHTRKVDSFLENLESRRLNTNFPLEALSVKEVKWVKIHGSFRHETLVLCRHAANSNDVMERVPPSRTRWFNICLCGPAEDRLVLSPRIGLATSSG